MAEATKREADDESWVRQEVIDTALAMNHERLSLANSGNVSARWGEGMLITPTGMAYDDLLPEDIVFVADDGATAQGARKPSSEWPFHLTAYEARPEAGAVVHCHSLNATALACARKPIPPFHYMVAVAGGSDIPLAGYATFGSDELAVNVGEALAERKACLMANHGQIACGASLDEALDLAMQVEELAAQYIRTMEAGTPHVLDAEEMARVIEKFSKYGQQGEG